MEEKAVNFDEKGLPESKYYHYLSHFWRFWSIRALIWQKVHCVYGKVSANNRLFVRVFIEKIHLEQIETFEFQQSEKSSKKDT